MKFGGVETIARARVKQFTIASKIFIIASVQSVVSADTSLASNLPPDVAVTLYGVRHSSRTKFKGEQRVLAPWDWSVDVNLVLGCAEMSETLSTSRSEINLMINARLLSLLSIFINDYK